LKPVGIIANPRSGKDIRRLVAYGSIFDNREKINILKRVFLALDALKVRDVVIMPDSFGMGFQARDDIEVSLNFEFLKMDVDDCQEDSTRAAQMMAQRDVACILTLGGDGTNRAVAKTCGDIPLLPLSTGTNNVFPYMVEGTLAGLAAGVVATGAFSPQEIGNRVPRLDIYRNGFLLDIALIDAVVSDHHFTGSRAVYDAADIHEIFISRTGSNQIGFSAVGVFLDSLERETGKGVHIVVGKGKQRVLAPIAPGLVHWIPIKSHHLFEKNERVPISIQPSFLALDGEREHYLGKKDQIEISFNPEGPLVVDVKGILGQARKKKMFVADQVK
jgi:predicted polyphosphate/ATP-dependent NAD kinase